jgi:hypothetical protein
VTPDLLLQSLEDLLTVPLKANGGAVNICGDRMHAYEVLLDAPANAYRAAVSLGGMKPAGQAAAHVWDGTVVSVEITIAVLRAAGLTLKPGKAVYQETAGGGVSLLQRGEQVRRLIVGARWCKDAAGTPRDDVDPAGCRFDGAKVLHLEKSDPDGGFLPVCELTFFLFIALPPVEDADLQTWTEGDPWTLTDQWESATLTAGSYTDRTDTLTFAQTTANKIITLEKPSDNSAKILTISHAGEVAFTLNPGTLVIEPGSTQRIQWSADAAEWQLLS